MRSDRGIRLRTRSVRLLIIWHRISSVGLPRPSRNDRRYRTRPNDKTAEILKMALRSALRTAEVKGATSNPIHLRIVMRAARQRSGIGIRFVHVILRWNWQTSYGVRAITCILRIPFGHFQSPFTASVRFPTNQDSQSTPHEMFNVHAVLQEFFWPLVPIEQLGQGICNRPRYHGHGRPPTVFQEIVYKVAKFHRLKHGPSHTLSAIRSTAAPS